MKKILLIFGLFMLFSCNKYSEKSVTYLATDALSDYTLQYLDEFGALHTILVKPASAKDVWKWETIKNEGDIIYLNGKYNDVNSALKLMILINGKTYKQASSIGDTVRYLVVSGTIPIDN